MLVVLVVRVRVVVAEQVVFVPVLVNVACRHEHTGRHHDAADQVHSCEAFSEHGYRDDRACERRGGKDCRFPAGPEEAERVCIEDDTEPVAHCP